MIDFIPIIIAYLLGSIPFGIIVTRIAGKGDIRKQGSGNIGATNVARVCGFKTALWVYVGDMGKAACAVLIAKWFAGSYELTLMYPDLLFVLTAAAAVLGNVFSVYLKFKGGKGVNAAMGSVVTLMPYEAILAFMIFLILALLTRYISIGSIIGVSSFFVILAIEKYFLHQTINMVYIYLGLILSILVFVTHRKNIVRLFSGTESKISFSSKKKEANSHV